MSEGVINVLIGFACFIVLMWVLADIGDNDDEPRGNALSFNKWQEANYRIVNDKYYRLSPPNRFENYGERKKRYRQYCYAKNNRR